MYSEINLDDLHELIDGLSSELKILQSHKDPKMEIDAAPYNYIGDALHVLEGRFDAPSKLVRTFTREFDPVTVSDASVLAARLISYLKSMEGEIAGSELNEGHDDKAPTEDADETKHSAGDEPLTSYIPGIRWVGYPQGQETKAKIAQISLLLDSVVTLAKSTNLPDADRALSEIDRAQLIAILETALLLLKAPLVEKGLMTKLGEALKDTVKKVLQKQTEGALGEVADEAQEKIVDLIKGLPWG